MRLPIPPCHSSSPRQGSSQCQSATPCPSASPRRQNSPSCTTSPSRLNVLSCLALLFFTLQLTGCQDAVIQLNCRDICEKYQECVDDSLNIDRCEDECFEEIKEEENDDDDNDYDELVNDASDCAACIDGKTCAEAADCRACDEIIDIIDD